MKVCDGMEVGTRMWRCLSDTGLGRFERFAEDISQDGERTLLVALGTRSRSMDPRGTLLLKISGQF